LKIIKETKMKNPQSSPKTPHGQEINPDFKGNQGKDPNGGEALEKDLNDPDEPHKDIR
jgi:hypothetical protein